MEPRPAAKQLNISPGEHRPHRKKFRQDKSAVAKGYGGTGRIDRMRKDTLPLSGRKGQTIIAYGEKSSLTTSWIQEISAVGCFPPAFHEWAYPLNF